MNPFEPTVRHSAVDAEALSDDEDHHYGALNAGEIGPQDASFTIPGLQEKRKKEGWLREDGDPKRVRTVDEEGNDVGLYGQKYLDQRQEVEKILQSDPNYKFVRLVSGNTHASVESYYELSPIQEFVRQRVLEAQQQAVRERRGVQYIEVVRKQIKDQKEQLAGDENEVEELEALRRDFIAGRAKYASSRDVAENVLIPVQYLAGRKDELKGALVRVTSLANDSYYYTYGARSFFDYLTRAACVAHGEQGFASEPFRRQVELIVDRTCGDLADEERTLHNLKDSIPTSSRLALYLAVLKAFAESSQLFEIAKRDGVHKSTSAYASDPEMYVQDVGDLASLVFAGVDGANYLVYEKITLGLYIKLREMHRKSNSLLPLPARPAVPQGGDGAARPNTVAGFEVIVEVDDDTLEAAQNGVDVPGRDISQDDVERMRNTPLDAGDESTSTDVRQLLLELLQPMYLAVFPKLVYTEASLFVNARIRDFGGRDESGDAARKLFRIESTKLATADEDKIEASPGNLDANAQIGGGSGRGRRRNVRSRYATLGIGQHQGEYGQRKIGEDWSTFPGLIALAIGIFYHAEHQDSTHKNVGHVLLDGLENIQKIVEQSLVVLSLDASDVQQYLSRYRERVIKEEFLRPYSEYLLLLSESFELSEVGFFAPETSVAKIRQYTESTSGDPGFTELQERVFRIFESEVGSEAANAAQNPSSVFKTRSNKALEKYAEPDKYSSLLQDIKARLDEEREQAERTKTQLKKLEDDLRERINQSDQELKEKLERGLQPTATLDPRVAMSPLNTGVVRLSAIFTSALANAHAKVSEVIPTLRSASRKLLQEDQRFRVHFAKLVASEIEQTAIHFPDVYRTDSALNRQLRREQSIINSLRIAASDMNESRSGSTGFHPHSHVYRRPQTFATSANYAQRFRASATRGYFR